MQGPGGYQRGDNVLGQPSCMSFLKAVMTTHNIELVERFLFTHNAGEYHANIAMSDWNTPTSQALHFGSLALVI